MYVCTYVPHGRVGGRNGAGPAGPAHNAQRTSTTTPTTKLPYFSHRGVHKTYILTAHYGAHPSDLACCG